jgi:hypothetical protein
LARRGSVDLIKDVAQAENSQRLGFHAANAAMVSPAKNARIPVQPGTNGKKGAQ